MLAVEGLYLYGTDGALGGVHVGGVVHGGALSLLQVGKDMGELF